MRRTKYTFALLLAAVALTAIVVGGSVAGAAPSAGAKAEEVIVANDATRPVPVQAQGTTWVAGTVEAKVTGTVAPAGQLVQFERFIALAPDGPPVQLIDAFEVPDRKRLVIEHVTGGIALHPEGRAQVRVGQSNGLHFLPFQLDPNAESDTFVNRATMSEATTFVVDDTGPGALELKIQVLREGPRVAVAAPLILTFVGRLYDL